MIVTCILFLYITFISWSYGQITVLFVKRINKDESPVISSHIILCFVGLSVIGVLFTLISLFIPLGGLFPHLILLSPSVVWFVSKRKIGFFQSIIKNRRAFFSSYLIASRIALFSCVLLILVMHAHTINHPDTLNYHAQSIKWIEKYRAVPGIVNLYAMYGLQSSWFILCALFSFKFTGTSGLTFINATVLIWFVLFIVNKINSCFHTGKKINGFLWLLLLSACFWSYTQIRLCATSGSPDFITALYLWLIIYLIVCQVKALNTSIYFLLIFLSFFAVTIKLQALPILLIPFYLYNRYDKGRISTKLLIFTLIGIIVTTPLLIRNVISSGYLLFPSAFPDFFSYDWKARKDYLIICQKYITAYARTNSDFSLDPQYYAYNIKLFEWLPIWWKLQSVADQIILASIPFFSALSIIMRKRIAKKAKIISSLPIFFLLGIVFWFVMAPDPRFGFGFLIPLIGFLILPLINAFEKWLIVPWQSLSIALLLFSITILSYSSFRIYNYFDKENILQPAGIANVPYKIIEKNGTRINTPENNHLCGDIDLPCSRLNCDSVIQRGNVIENGFRRIDIK